MPAHRVGRTHRQSRPLGERSPAFYVKNRRGEFLLDPTSRPTRWSERRGLVFLSRQAAERAIERHFVGKAAARELLGLHVVALP
jgi:hypothetical protein